MVADKGAELTVTLRSATNEDLARVAKLNGIDAETFCRRAIISALSKDQSKPQNSDGQPYDFDDLFAFSDYLLGNRTYSGNSVDIIREGRAYRTIQMEEW